MKSSIFEKDEKKKKDKNLLVAASVIAAMAYQAAISPPGGVAGVDALTKAAPPTDSYFDLHPGDSLLDHFYPRLSNWFWIANTISLIASLSVIFLYVSGLSLKRKIQVWIVRAAMWITLTSMTVAYVCAVFAITPVDYGFDELDDTIQALVYAVIAWLALLFLSFFVLVYHFIRYIVKKVKKKYTSKKVNTSADPARGTDMV